MSSQSEHRDRTFAWKSGQSWFSNRGDGSGARKAIFFPGVTPPPVLPPPHATATSPDRSSAAANLLSFIFDYLVCCDVWENVAAARRLPLQRPGEQPPYEVAPEHDVD